MIAPKSHKKAALMHKRGPFCVHKRTLLHVKNDKMIVLIEELS